MSSTPNAELKDLVKDNKLAYFSYYRDNALWYMVDDFVFPVPISDVGTATFGASEKAITLLRYIRKYVQEIENQHD
jgi:hypothetical protein